MPGARPVPGVLAWCAKPYIAGQLHRAHVLKRGGGVRPLSLDAETLVVSRDRRAGRPVARGRVRRGAWPLRVLDLALAELRAEFGETKRELFDAVIGSLGSGDGEPSYRELGDAGTAEGAVKVAGTAFAEGTGETSRNRS